MTRTSTNRSNAGKKGDGATTFAFPLARLTEANGTGALAFFGMNHALLDDWSEMQREAQRFLQHRFEENVERNRKLAGCRDAADAWTVQADFVQKMAADYAEATNRMTELACEMGSACSRFGAELAHAAEEAGDTGASGG